MATASSSEPPPYSSVMSTGFPSGYFLIKSVGTERLLDIELNSEKDGTEVIAWPETETSLVEGCLALGLDKTFIDILCRPSQDLVGQSGS